MEGDLDEALKAWRNRRVFLTGHTGFKGSWLTLWLNRLGAKVRGYALDPSTKPNMFTLVCAGIAVEDVRADIRDLNKLESSMKEFAPEVVFHMAAQPLVRRSYADPAGTYAINAMGTVHVLEAVRRRPACAPWSRSRPTRFIRTGSGSGLTAKRISLAVMTRMRPAKLAPKLSAQLTKAHSFRPGDCTSIM